MFRVGTSGLSNLSINNSSSLIEFSFSALLFETSASNVTTLYLFSFIIDTKLFLAPCSSISTLENLSFYSSSKSIALYFYYSSWRPNFLDIKWAYISDYYMIYSSLFFCRRASFSSSYFLLISFSNFSFLFLRSANSLSLLFQKFIISLVSFLALTVVSFYSLYVLRAFFLTSFKQF